MNSIVLFRFHAHFDVCYERIKLIRWLNPSIPVYALYGGPAVDFTAAARCLGPLVEGMWPIIHGDVRWKWLHQDAAVKEWYERHGSALTFDVAFDYEYDLLLVEPLASAGPVAAGRAIALSGVKPLREAQHSWYWTAVEPYASGFRRYTRYMFQRYGVEQQGYVSQGPFPVLPRAFLDALCRQDYPADVFGWVNCETSYPGMAEALGFAIVDTGLHPGWIPSVPSIPVSTLFHCERAPLVTKLDVLRELAHPSGRRAFHPVKEMVEAEAIIRATARGSEDGRRDDAQQ